MQTMHPTLLIGPADWVPARMPQEEFLARIAALWRVWPNAQGMIVFGSPISHAALAYLTHFTPKLDSALALIPRIGAPRLLVGGGINMVAAAKPLTWIENVQPLHNAAQTVAMWAHELPRADIVHIGCDAMCGALYREVFDTPGAEFNACDATEAASQHMRIKSARERAAIEAACATLNASIATLQQAKQSGATTVEAVLAGERTAYLRGVQDVRTLFSLDDGRTLRPFETARPDRIDPLQACLAIRHAGYWAEGFVVVTDKAHPPLDHARAALQTALPHVKSGTSGREIAACVAAAVRPYEIHAVTTQVVQPIGLSLQDSIGEAQMLLPGEIVSLRVGVSDADEGAAIVSAMVAVTENGQDVLWIAPGADG